MSARELKRALEEMVRRRLVSNFSLPLSVFVFVRLAMVPDIKGCVEAITIWSQHIQQ